MDKVIEAIEPNYDLADPEKMKLPKGKTCGDCRHIHRCKAIFGHVETDTYCDWSPSRAVFLRANGGNVEGIE
jgi:hypothetical protein